MFNSSNNKPSIYESAVENAQEQQKIDIQKQNNDLRKQEIQLQQQQLQTNTMLAVGGLAIAGILVLVVSFYILSKVFKRKNK